MYSAASGLRVAGKNARARIVWLRFSFHSSDVFARRETSAGDVDATVTVNGGHHPSPCSFLVLSSHCPKRFGFRVCAGADVSKPNVRMAQWMTDADWEPHSVFVRQVRSSPFRAYLTCSSSPPNFQLLPARHHSGVWEWGWVCLFMDPICTHHETGDEVVPAFIS